MNTNRRLVAAVPGLVLLALALVVPSAAAQPVAQTPSPVTAPSPVAKTQPAVAVAPVAKPAVAVAPVAIAPAAPAPAAIPVPAAMPQAAPLPPEASQPPQAPPAPQAQTVRPARPPQPPQPPQPVPAPAPPREPAPTVNVKVEVTITDQTEGNPPTKKSISLTVAEGMNGSVRSGVKVPILSTSFVPVEKGGAPVNPMASYSYTNMGLSLDVRNVRVIGNTVVLNLSVEYNPVDEKTSGAGSAIATPPSPGQTPPSFATFQQSLSLVLESGKPLVVAQSSDPVPGRDRKASLEVKATILK
jgi:hypothetical protein